jgi:Icc protein
MKLLQMTDIHLTTPGQTIGGRDPNANFRKALDHALSFHSDAEALVITGDLSDWGEADDYARLKEAIALLPLPVKLCIGNHDDRPTFLEVFPELADENGFVQGTFPLSQGIGVLLDTWGPETHAGHFCADRCVWLDRVLTEGEGPFWLFMHHNPVPTHIGPTDQIMLLEAERFAAVVAKHRERIAHIFHGHCHLPLSGSLHGVPYSSPRGTNHAGWSNFAETEFLSASDLPEAYTVIIAQGAGITVHMIEYGYSGEIRVEGAPDYTAWDRETMVR